MKNIKIYLTILMGGIILLSAGIAKADNTVSLNKDFNYQLVNQIKHTVQIPLLKYKDKDLKGLVTVSIKVESSGKVTFTSIEGLNQDLTLNVQKKLMSLNLWTNEQLSGTTKKYELLFN